jgi:hypothetical protein
MFKTIVTIAKHGRAYPLDKFKIYSKLNTCLNFCGYDQTCVIKRSGKIHRVKDLGLFWSIPFVESITIYEPKSEDFSKYKSSYKALDHKNGGHNYGGM